MRRWLAVAQPISTPITGTRGVEIKNGKSTWQAMCQEISLLALKVTTIGLKSAPVVKNECLTPLGHMNC